MPADQSQYWHRESVDYQPGWFAIVLSIAAITMYAFSPYRSDLPMASVSILGYFVGMIIWPGCRPRFSDPLCPLNFGLVLFGLQLVILPLLTLYFGFSRGTLQFLPSEKARNIALLLTTIAYLAFAGSYHFSSRGYSRKEATDQDSPTGVYPQLVVLMIPFFAIVGLVGFFLVYRSWGQYMYYLTDPSSKGVLMDPLSGTLGGAASTFLRPFLAFSVVLAWGLWIDKHRDSGRWQVKLVITLLVAVLVILMNLSFSYNRGAMLGPVLAMFAAFSRRIRRISLSVLVLTGTLLFGVVLVWGTYRTSDMTIKDLADPSALSSVSTTSNMVDWLQVYGAAPQFPGFLIEQLGYGERLYWGQTLFSSLLYPVPVVGKAFRSTSGVEIYNMLIYGDEKIVDQVIPFQAELFINFHFLGVILGYALLGFITFSFQRWFEQSRNTFENYCIFLMSIWTLFLIPGSLAVTSQIYTYLFWPIYIYFLVSGRKSAQLNPLQS